MSNLYYLLPSLPTLLFDLPPKITYEEFLRVAEGNVSESEMARLKSFNLYNPPRSLDGLGELEKLFWDWEAGLRNELVRLRAAALGVRADDYLRPIGTAGMSRDTAAEIFKEDNPLIVEERLDRARWALLEGQKGGRVFHFDLVLIFGLQLQILARRAGFVLETGKRRYNEEYKRILGDAETVLTENIS